MHRYDLENESWKLEWIILRWRAPYNQTEKTPELLWMGEKNFSRSKLWEFLTSKIMGMNNYEDGMKLEPWIFKRTDQDLGEILLRSSNVANDDAKHHHELVRHSGTMKNRKVESTMKRIWKILEKDIWLMIIHSYVKLRKEFGNGSGKIRRVR